MTLNTRRSGASRRLIAILAVVAVAIATALAAISAPAAASSSGGAIAIVSVDGRCLNLREQPSVTARSLTCLPDGSIVTLHGDDIVEADGHRWREIDAGIERGWAAEEFLALGEAGEEPPQSTDGPATITYYYCEQGENEAAWGDGGGFCGTLRSGTPVHEGAAACSPENFGQRFRITGDPHDRVYTCEDTGKKVTGDHRDIWFHNSDDGFEWLTQVGRHAEIFLVGEDGEPLTRSGEFSPEPNPAGLTIAAFDGSLEQFEEAATELALTACFATTGGTFVGYTFGAPEFVNGQFAAEFDEGLKNVALLCRRP